MTPEGHWMSKRPPLGHDARVFAMSIGAGLPAVVVALALLWTGDHSPKLEWTLTAVIVGGWLGLGLALREEVVRPLQVLSNLLGALREGDYSMRARSHGAAGDALATAFAEANALTEILREQRLGALEAVALLGKVMAEIDVAVYALDDAGRLRLANRAGAALLGRPIERLVGQPAAAVGLADLCAGDAPRTLEATFPGGSGPWELRRSSFRQDGRPHTLLVLSDLQRALREEERQAWKRLVRVLGHEINNSLAPIQSIAASLSELLTRPPPARPPGWEDDLSRGLGVVGRRAEALGRFMTSYARLARLPPPRIGEVDVAAWVARVVELEKRLPIRVVPGPPVALAADGDQLDQLLINVLQNAVDAALETGGAVEVRWSATPQLVELEVADEGPGIGDATNLFVPFFTTKPQGSGIGLVLSRQIAEGHAGAFTLTNRAEGPGCVARVRLPRRARAQNRQPIPSSGPTT